MGSIYVVLGMEIGERWRSRMLFMHVTILNPSIFPCTDVDASKCLVVTSHRESSSRLNSTFARLFPNSSMGITENE